MLFLIKDVKVLNLFILELFSIYFIEESFQK